MAAVPATACEPHAAQAVSVQGTAEMQRAASGWRPLSPGDRLCDGDRVRVLRNARAVLLLADQTSLALDQNTTVTLGRLRKDASSWLEVLRGALYFLSRTPEALRVRTAFVNAAIEGTEFAVRVDDGSTRVFVLEGVVALTNPLGELRLAANESAVALAGAAPRPLLAVRPRDAVRWALHYPPIIDLRPERLPASAGAVLDAYRRDDVDAALRLLADLPAAQRSAQVRVLEAGLLLSVGRVVEAEAAITTALREDPRNAGALALQSVVATVGNRRDAADRLAERAVALAPDAPAASMALSYARQARFDLPGAAAAARRAVDADPGNALAWARLSELSLALGERRAAVQQAERAAALDPDLARSQTVLGFALLGGADLAGARDHFERALALAPALPLARLGLGLSLIRAGRLDAGVEQLEIAATLDPDNALLRSYLGKGYYEQKRPKLAAVQFAIAEQLDPLDPTAPFYDSILLLTINRPIAALHQNLRAQALNDNRAVFRSRLMLDEDLAARSATQGRIFDTLGFQQLGLLEGVRALQADPANASAHRLMADLYASIPRHEVARVSELLQSQLLQPANIVPIQPQVSTNNLGVLRGLGPASLGFSEYTPLFASNGFSLQINALAGTRDTYANDLVVGYLHDNLSVSFGQFHYETEGYRDNNQDRQEILNALVQMDLTPELSVQVEGRHRERSFGDLDQTYDGSFDPTRRTDWTRDSVRGGLHWSPSPDSDLVLSVQHERFTGELHRAEAVFEQVFDSMQISGLSVDPPLDEPPAMIAPGLTSRTTTRFDGQADTFGDLDIAIDITSESDASDQVLELLYLLRREGFDLTLGGGYLWQDTTRETTLDTLRVLNATRETRLDLDIETAFALATLPPITFTRSQHETETTREPVTGASHSVQVSRDEKVVRQGNLFAYLNLHPFEADLVLTLGLSYDRLDDVLKRTSVTRDDAGGALAAPVVPERDDLTADQLNPKLGLVWSPNERLMLRAALFRTLNRSLVENKTLEPTQIAGFNQLYDDLLGTEATRGGIGVDYRFGRNLFGGFELSARHLKTPRSFDDAGDVEQDERLHRAYLYWAPSECVAVHGQVVYDDYRSDRPLVADAPTGVRDFFLPVGVRYFHPNGLFGGIMGTYVDQRVELEQQRDVNNSFWVFDAVLGYRLPRRLGTVVLQARNLADRDFDYQDSNFRTTEPLDPRWVPDRSVFLTINLAL